MSNSFIFRTVTAYSFFPAEFYGFAFEILIGVQKWKIKTNSEKTEYIMLETLTGLPLNAVAVGNGNGKRII